MRDTELERIKMLNELLTQLTTLGAGSLVLIATLFQTFSPHAAHTLWAAVSIVCFLVTIVLSLVSKFACIAQVSDDPGTSRYWQRFPGIMFISSAGAFVI